MRTRFYILIILATMLCVACSNENISFKKGEQFYAMGEYYQAAQQYKKSYQRIPTKDKALRADRAFRMGLCYERINNPQKAMQTFQNAVRYHHTDSTALLHLGRQQLKLANYKGARESFTAFLDIDANNEQIKNGCGYDPRQYMAAFGSIFHSHGHWPAFSAIVQHGGHGGGGPVRGPAGPGGGGLHGTDY